LSSIAIVRSTYGDTVILLSHQVGKRSPSLAQLKDAVRKWYAAVQ